MVEATLTSEQKKGMKLAIFVNLLVLVVFLTVLLTGSPIVFFHTAALSGLYSVIIYVPVIVLCIIAFRRLGS